MLFRSVPGKPEKSAIIARIITEDRDDVMPPPKEKKPVKPADIEKLRQWIKDGAPYAGHWAFTAPVKPRAAVALFREGRMSSGVAARWLKVPRVRFLLLAMEKVGELLADPLAVDEHDQVRVAVKLEVRPLQGLGVRVERLAEKGVRDRLFRHETV